MTSIDQLLAAEFPQLTLHKWYIQFRELKASQPDAVLLYRLGDFYEAFDDDAKLVAELLDVTLTYKEFATSIANQKQRCPMAGMPYHAVESYVTRLVAAGYRVAIAEQISETASSKSDTRPRSVFAGGIAPSSATKGMVERQIVRIVTPGTVVDGNLLNATTNNYICAVINGDKAVGLAYADLTTGEFACCEFAGATATTQALGEVARLQPAEILVSDSPKQRIADLAPQNTGLQSDLEFMTKAERELLLPHERVARRLERDSAARWAHGHVTAFPAWRWDERNASESLLRHFAVQSLAGLGLAHRPYAAQAAGALLQYAQSTQQTTPAQLATLHVYTAGAVMFLDPQTRRNLELLEGVHGQHTSLIGVLDQTRTPMGARLLRRWVAQPLIDRTAIAARHDEVAHFVAQSMVRNAIRDALRGIGDMERTVNRMIQGVSVTTPRDVVKLRDALRQLPAIAQALTGSHDDLFDDTSRTSIDSCAEVLAFIEQAIDHEPPALLGASNYLRGDDEQARRVIRPGWHAEMDHIVAASRDAQRWISQLEALEQQRTGIKTLKVEYNKVQGYYIEVSKTNSQLVPTHYIRKQTLATSERYFTDELKTYEEIVVNAQERLNELERTAFFEIVSTLAQSGQRLLAVARTLATLDVVTNLAEIAVSQRYVRPSMRDDTSLHIRNGRHPVVEHQLGGRFIANSVSLTPDTHLIGIITGANMTGKSTVMRQVALIVLLAQIGSFVPADAAEIGLVDRIFTRIGAQDDIATGQSTFMVEMTETAAILAQCTPKSLIVLDEVGRGTSTYDGMAIAQALIEHIHDDPQLRCRTLFATHYHELTQLSERLSLLGNWHMAAMESNGDVVFLHELRRGSADRSYGIHVAQIAGIPRSVIRRATQLLRQLEQGASLNNRPQQPSLFEAPTPAPAPLHPAIVALRKLDPNQMTPMQALNALSELSELADRDAE